MPNPALLFFIITILCIIIPIIICYKIFSKGEKKSLVQGISLVSILTFSPLSFSTAGVKLSIQTILIILLILGLLIGFSYAYFNYAYIKKNIQSHDHTIINFAFGSFIIFSSFDFFAIFILTLIFYKNEKIIISNIEINGLHLFFISIYIFLFSFGIFFSIVFEFLFYKYQKNQIGIYYAFIYQLFVYSSNYLVAFLNWFIILIIICPIINIIIGFSAWKSYSTDETKLGENNNNSSNELITHS